MPFCVFLVAHWVSSWQLFWILCQLCWFLENCHLFSVVQCDCFLMILNELSCLCIWNERLDVTVLSFVCFFFFFFFLVGGTITQIFGFSYWVPLVIFETWHVPASTVCLRTVALGLPCSFFCIWGHCCLASAVAAVVTGMVGSCLMSRIPWVTGLAAVTGGGWPGISRLYSCLLSVSGVMAQDLPSKVEGQGLESWACRHGRDWIQVPLPRSLWPVARVWLWNGRWSCVCHLPYCSWFSEAVGSAAMVRGLGLQDTDSAAPLVPAHRCVSVLPPLDV